MPLILLCGHPSSGKTYRAKQIVRFLTEKLENPNGETNANGPRNGLESTVKELSELNIKGASPSSTASAISTKSPDHSETQAVSESSEKSSSVPIDRSHRQTKPTQPQRKIHYISDHTLDIPRSSYLTAKQEKDARGALYSAVKRALSRNDIVILDSGNYIKGWRYQLYCEAKNIGTSSCVVHVGVPSDKCRELNNLRLSKTQPATNNDNPPNTDEETNNEPGQEYHPTINGSKEQDPYDEKTHSELLMRFEEPNPMTRWDTPLYTVPYEDSTPPLEQLWNETILGIGKDGKTKVIRPNQATVLTPATAPSHLYNLERTTQGVISAIQTHQQESGGAAEGDTVAIPAGGEGSGAKKKLELTLPATPVTFPHLQRLRRQFIALHRQQMGGMGMGGVGGGHGAGGMALSPERVAELFVGFLSERFAE